jgi:hypothetical protein
MNHSKSDSSFISSGLEYKDPKYYLTRNASRGKSFKKRKAFRPPGSLSETSQFPYMPNAFNEKRLQKKGKGLKNFLVPVKNRVFSRPEFLSNVENKEISKIVLKKGKNRKEKPPFLTSIQTSEVFSKIPYSVDVKCEKKGKSEVKEKEIEVRSNDRNLEDKIRAFKVGGRSTSEVFSRFRYESETLFPFKKNVKSSSSFIQKPFKRSAEVLSVASPNILTAGWTIKKEYRLY